VFSIIFKKYDSGNRHDREKRLILERERERETIKKMQYPLIIGESLSPPD
jgi:hypothetical protein